MQVQVDIQFEQLLKIVQDLPTHKLKKLKAVINKEKVVAKNDRKLLSLLLNGPTATANEIHVIENNRKAINSWRSN
jgi:hypothetical protein